MRVHDAPGLPRGSRGEQDLRGRVGIDRGQRVQRAIFQRREIEPRQGTAAQGAAAAVILASSQLGFALSTTHVATGSIVGTGIGKPGASVRWRVAGRMAVAWFITLPAAALVGAATWEVGDAVGGGLVAALVMVALLVAMSIMTVLMSVAMPAWRQATQREKEAELIFRGQQYARAIVLFALLNPVTQRDLGRAGAPSGRR